MKKNEDLQKEVRDAINFKPLVNPPETGFIRGATLKKYLFIFALGFFSLGALANPPLASKQQIGMFINSKTCVVLGTSSIPLSYSDDNNDEYEYVIPAIVKFMQIHAKNLETKRFFISLKGLRYYNSPSGFKDKVLMFNKDMMASDANSPEKIKAVYTYYVKLLTSSEIQKELSSSPTNALFNFHVGPTQNAGSGKCFEMIFDIEGNLYYYNSRKITNDNENGFNLKDFSHIG